jgi:hypothetical protein
MRAPLRSSKRAVCPRSCDVLVCLIVSLLLALPGFVRGDSSELDAIAGQIADAIQHASKVSSGKPFVLVDGFDGTSGKETELSGELTNDLAQALRLSAKNFQVMSADEPAAFFQGHSKDWCPVNDQQTSFVVDGTSTETGGQIDLHLLVRQTINKRDGEQRTIFDQNVSLPLSSERQDLATRKFGASAGDTTKPIGWERAGFRAPEDLADVLDFDLGNAKKNIGYKMPQRLSGRYAPFTDAAVSAGMSGTVKLKVLIDANGDPARIDVLSGLPCGLTKAAIDAFSQWKLAPAKDPTGKPIAAWVLAEQNFSLH